MLLAAAAAASLLLSPDIVVSSPASAGRAATHGDHIRAVGDPR